MPTLSRIRQTLAFSGCAADEPWINLFNGHDNTGWKIVGLRDPAPVAVEDGAMVLRQRPHTSEHTFVSTHGTYRDFILELDLEDDPGFNSGILLGCSEAPATAQVRLNGYHVKIDNTPPRVDWRYLRRLRRFMELAPRP